MSLPRWLLRLIPALAPRGTWADAVRVADPVALARLARCYAETVDLCRARGFPILAPSCEVVLRVWPEHLRGPKEFDGYVGKVLAPEVIKGDAHGTMLLRQKWLGAEWLIRHESYHGITGDPTHPSTAFNPDGTLKC